MLLRSNIFKSFSFLFSITFAACGGGGSSATVQHGKFVDSTVEGISYYLGS